MSSPADSAAREYDNPPVYDRVPSIQAIEKVQRGMRPAEALKDELPAAVRATLRS